MTHSRTPLLIVGSLALLVVSVGCRGSRNEAEYEPMMAPPYEEGPYDSQPYNADPFDGYGGESDGGPLMPVPQSGSRDRGTITLPDPTASNRGRTAPPMPTTRRESASLPIEGDRGLMPTSGTNDGSSHRFWPFGTSHGRRATPPRSQPRPPHANSAERRMQTMPPPAPGITGRLRRDARYVAGRETEVHTAAHNPVQIEGLEFDATEADVSPSVAGFESEIPAGDAQLTDSNQTFDDEAFDTSPEPWRLAEGESHVDVWPFAAAGMHPLADPAATEALDAAGTAVPVSATRIGDDEKTVEPIPYDPDAPLPLITPGLRRTGPVELAPPPASRRTAVKRTALPMPEPVESIDEDIAPPSLAAPGIEAFDE